MTWMIRIMLRPVDGRNLMPGAAEARRAIVSDRSIVPMVTPGQLTAGVAANGPDHGSGATKIPVGRRRMRVGAATPHPRAGLDLHLASRRRIRSNCPSTLLPVPLALSSRTVHLPRCQNLGRWVPLPLPSS